MSNLLKHAMEECSATEQYINGSGNVNGRVHGNEVLAIVVFCETNQEPTATCMCNEK